MASPSHLRFSFRVCLHPRWPCARRLRRSSVPPLMGFALPPLPTSLIPRPLPPDPKVRLRPSATTPTACSVLVVSHHLDGLLRERAVSLLRLTASWRSAAFPVRSSTCTLPKQHSVERVRTFPRSAFSHPSKDSPHLQPYRVTTAVAFLTFHSLLHRRVRLRRDAFNSLVLAISEEMTRPIR